MRRFLAVVVVSAALAGCAGGASTGGGGPDSGVRGVVLAGPQCPVERAESPCPDAPWVGSVSATRADERVEQRTDQQGRFEIALSPGRWTLAPVVGGGGIPSARPVVVTVPPHRFVRVDLSVDTGIR